jgi:hypothetical protein
MQLTYTRAVHYGTQSESLTISDEVDYPDQVLERTRQLKAIACKSLNVLPYEHKSTFTESQFHPDEALSSSAN